MSYNTDRLAAVRAAIAAILAGGESVRYKDRQVTMANYAQLCADEKNLIAAVAQETRAASGGGRFGVTYITPR